MAKSLFFNKCADVPVDKLLDKICETGNFKAITNYLNLNIMEIKKIESVFFGRNIFMDEESCLYRYDKKGSEYIAQKMIPVQASPFFELYVLEGNSGVIYLLIDISGEKRRLVPDTLKETTKHRFFRFLGRDFAVGEECDFGQLAGFPLLWRIFQRQADGKFKDKSQNFNDQGKAHLTAVDFEGDVLTLTRKSRMRDFEKVFYVQGKKGFQQITENEAGKMIAKYRRVNVLNIPKGWKKLSELGFFMLDDYLSCD